VAPVGCWRINNLATIPGTPVATVHTVQSPETARCLLYLQGEQALIFNGEILNAGWDVHQMPPIMRSTGLAWLVQHRLYERSYRAGCCQCSDLLAFPNDCYHLSSRAMNGNLGFGRLRGTDMDTARLEQLAMVAQ
jgi:hypothetical protein